MEAAPSKEQLPTNTNARKNILRRKTNISAMTMPTLLTLYFLGACIAFMVCTRTFLSFDIFSQAEESQPPVQLPGQEERLPSESAGLEILEKQIIQSPAHTRRDVRSIADNSWKYSAVGSFGEVEDHSDSDEPEFMQQPVLRMNSANSKAANLEARYCQRYLNTDLVLSISLFQKLYISQCTLAYYGVLYRKVLNGIIFKAKR